MNSFEAYKEYVRLMEVARVAGVRYGFNSDEYIRACWAADDAYEIYMEMENEEECR